MPDPTNFDDLIKQVADADRIRAEDYRRQVSQFNKDFLATVDVGAPTDRAAKMSELAKANGHGYKAGFDATGAPKMEWDGEMPQLPVLEAVVRQRTKDPAILAKLDKAKQDMLAHIEHQTNYLDDGSGKIMSLGKADRESLKSYLGMADKLTPTEDFYAGQEANRQAALGRQAEQLRGVLGDNPILRQALSGVAAGTAKVALTPIGLLLGKLDKVYETTDALSAMNRKADEQVGPAKVNVFGLEVDLGKIAGGATESLTEAAALGGLGRAIGLSRAGKAGEIIGGKLTAKGAQLVKDTAYATTLTGFAAIAGSAAYVEGEQAGLRGTSLASYVVTTAATEGLLSWGLNKVFGKGLEGMFGREGLEPVVRQGFLKAMGNAGKSILEELPEEVGVEITQAVLSKLHGVDPSALDGSSLKQLIVDTVAQTIVTVGAGHAPGLAAGAANSMFKVNPQTGAIEGTPMQTINGAVSLERQQPRSPEREAKIAEIAAKTGTTPQALRALPDSYLDMDYTDARAVAKQSPGLLRYFAQDTSNMVVSKGDHLTLAAIERVATDPSHAKEGVKGNPLAEAGAYYQDAVSINEMVQNSQTRTRSEAKAVEALTAMGVSRGVRLDANAIMEIIQDKPELEAALRKAGVSQDAILAASDSGQTVQADLASMAVKLAPEEFKQIAKAIRRNENAASVHEVETVDMAAETKRVSESLVEYRRKEEVAGKERERLVEAVRNVTVKKDGTDHKYTKDEATKVVALLDAADRRLAARGGERGDFLGSIASIGNAETTGAERGVSLPRGLEGRQKSIVALFNNADMTTLLHEASHLFMFEMEALVKSGKASEDAVKDMATLRDWLGAKDGEALSRDQHERFAEAFEQYLMEGKSPSNRLFGAFQRFGHWLKSVYKEVGNTYFDRVKLSDDVRMVFDRMLASEEETARAIMEQDLMLRGEEEMKAAGIPEADRQHVNDLLEAGRAKVEMKLTAERNRKLRPLMKQWREEAKAIVDKDPRFQAAKAIKEQGGLRWARIKFDFGEDTVKALREKGLIATKEDSGAQPEETAERYGFDSAEDMIDQMLDMPTERDAINAYVEGKLRSNDMKSDPFQAIAETPEFAKAMDEMAKYYGKAAQRGENPKTREQINQRAKDVMADMPVRDVQAPDTFLSRARDFTQRERRAALKGDFAAALEANEKARLNLELAKLSRQFVDRRDSLRDRVKSAAKTPKQGQIRIDEDFQKQIAYLGVRFGLLPRDMEVDLNKPALAKILASVDPDVDIVGMFDPRLVDEAAMNSWTAQDGKPVMNRDMSVDQFEQLANIMDLLITAGHNKANEFIEDGKTRAADVAAASVVEMSNLKDQQLADRSSWFGKMAENLGEAWSWLTHMDLALYRADNQPATADKRDMNKPLTKHIIARARQADNDYQRRMGEVSKLLAPHIKVLTKAMNRIGNKVKLGVDVPEIIAKRRGQKLWLSPQLLGAVLNMGCVYNRTAVAEGYGWSAADEATMPAELAEIARKFTAEELQAVQGVWDALDSLWSDSAAAHKAIYGITPGKVEATPFTVQTADGKSITLKGGYFPVVFDPRLSLKQDKLDEEAILKDLSGQAFAPAAAKRGHLKSRQGTGGKPILLDPMWVIDAHLDHTVRFVTHGQFVRDANRVFTNKAFASTFADKFGTTAYKQLNGWLRAQIGRETERLSPFDKVMEYFRPLTAMALLGAKVWGAVNQISTAPMLIGDVGFKTYMGGVGRWLRPAQMKADWDFMMENSPMMKRRWAQGAERDVKDLLRNINLGKFAKVAGVLKAGQEISLWPVVKPAVMMEAVAWNAVFNKTLNQNGGDVKAASSAADLAITSTQADTAAMSQSEAERSRKGVLRMLTMLMSFSIRTTGSMAATYKAAREGRFTAAELIRYGFFMAVAAPLLPAILKSLARGDDEDKMTNEMLKAVVGFQIQGIPIVGRAVPELVGSLAAGDGLPTRSRLMGSTAITDVPGRVYYETLSQLAKAFEGEDNDAAYALADLLSFHAGIPAAKLYKELTTGYDQWQNEDGTVLNLFVNKPKER